MMPAPHSARRRFRLQPNEYLPFSPGTNAEGRHVLSGWLDSSIVAIYFQHDGLFDDISIIEIAAEDGTPEEAWETWKFQVGFRPSAFAVEQFSLDEPLIAISELPQDYADYLVQLHNNRSQQPNTGVIEAIASWQQNDQYVLYWGYEYWMSKDGEVTAT